MEAHNDLLVRFAKEGPGAQVILVSDSVLSASELKILRTKRQFCLKGAHPCTSSSEQGGCKRVLEAFF